MPKLTYLFFLVPLAFLVAACDMTPKPEKTISLAANGLFSASLSKNYALIGTKQGYAELWKIKGRHVLIHRWKHTDEENGIIATDISESEEYAITAEENSIAWWRVTDGSLQSVWSLPGINSINISPDGQFALIGLADKAIYLALQYGKTLYAFSHQGRVVTADISGTGNYAITGSVDKTAKLWDLRSGQLKYTWQHQNKLSTVAISHNDRYAVTNAALNQTRIWELSNGQLHKEIGPRLITLSSAKFSTNNRHLLTAHTTRRIDLWNIKSGKLIKFWRAKKIANEKAKIATILALEFTAHNKKFQSITGNGFVQKWRK